MGSSGRFIMNPSWVHQKGRLSPWWRTIFLKKGIEIGCITSILPIPEFLFHISGSDQIIQGAFYGASGHPQLPGHGRDGRPAAPVPVCPVMQVHIDRHCPVRQTGGIDPFKISHIPSFNLSVAAAWERVCGAAAGRYAPLPAPVPYRRLQAVLTALVALQTLPCHHPSVYAGSPAPVSAGLHMIPPLPHAALPHTLPQIRSPI